MVQEDRRVRRILEMMRSQGPHSVHGLASSVNLSPAHLERLFKRETGKHIGELVLECRLQRAAHLLSTSEMEIKEIAFAVGYEHHSSFVRAFRRRFGQCPNAFRKSLVPKDSN